MPPLPGPIQQAIDCLVRLPGIGRRGAERIVTHLLASPPSESASLSAALAALAQSVRPCQSCGNWSEAPLCSICSDPSRLSDLLCVVERPADLAAFEQAGAFRGRYHVLGGVLSPLLGVAPQDLDVDRLIRRVQSDAVREVILATNPTVEGDATAHYLLQRLRPLGVAVARIAVGLPLGAHLGYADPGTLKLALEGRRLLAD